jgi:hypothetical protein
VLALFDKENAMTTLLLILLAFLILMKGLSNKMSEEPERVKVEEQRDKIPPA